MPCPSSYDHTMGHMRELERFVPKADFSPRGVLGDPFMAPDKILAEYSIF